jgi:putative MATE family efflux protein
MVEVQGLIRSKKIDLTTGDILPSLIRMALPILGTSFVQMAYNLTDMFWIGFLGSNAVAAVGIAGFFVWLSQAFIMLSKTGTEIRVAQTTGRKDDLGAEKYARNGLVLIGLIAAVYSIILLFFRVPLIGFFDTGDPFVEGMAVQYLAVIAIGILFPFANQVFTGIFNGRGDSRTPFLINVTGLVINIILDPLLIHGFWFVPKMGVIGAAVATVFAQGIVFAIFIYNIKFKHVLFEHFKLFKGIELEKFKEIMRLGGAPALQSALFTMISMVIAKIIAVYGPGPIAVQKVGSQIESISWMTATGVAVALSAFVGQNYGADQYGRVVRGYRTAMKLAFALGIFNTFLLFFGAKWLFMIFIREPEAIPLGIDYLRILGLSQLFMCIEITTTGAFNGIGHTKPAAFISITFNLLRIPMALYFSQMTFLGLNGIWWSISISSLFKGIIVYALFEKLIRTRREFVNS